MISIGFAHVSINDTNEYFLWNVEGTVIFKGNADFSAGSKIAVGMNVKLTFGQNFLITARSEIAFFKEIRFGDDYLLSWDILAMDTDAHSIYDEQMKRMNEDKSIIIGKHVWIGCRTLILKRAEIGDGCIVGANSLINKKFNFSQAVLGGNPVKMVKENVRW